ncbi:MAG TPA: hypothetical protein VF399_03205 [bacterium]
MNRVSCAEVCIPFVRKRSLLKTVNRSLLGILLFIACSVKYTLPDYDNVPDANLKLITISNKVGDTIDSLERNQYHLLPKAVNFSSAKIYTIFSDTTAKEAGYVVEIITTDNNKFRAVYHDNYGSRILTDMVDNYETYSAKRDSLIKLRKVLYFKDREPVFEKIKDPLEAERQIVEYDDCLGLPITAREVLKFKKNSNFNRYAGIGCVSGCLLYATGCIIGFSSDGFMTTGLSVTESITSNSLMVAGLIIGGLAGPKHGDCIEKREMIKAIKKGRRLRLVE